MFRKEDAAVTDWSEETVSMCADRQSEILNSAAEMLRPGGRLVYSTCTFAPEENEGVVSRFLHSHPDYDAEAVDAPWFDRGHPDWIDDPADGAEHTFRLWPHKLRGEGHFAAVLRRCGEEARTVGALQKTEALPDCVKDFLSENRLSLSGNAVSFGETVYLAPEGLPDLRGLHVLRAGLELGEVRKGRFVPAHALALTLTDFPAVADYPADSSEIDAYLHGQTLFAPQRGWVLVCVDGYPLGWSKGADGVLKNHYPKGLRRL